MLKLIKQQSLRKKLKVEQLAKMVNFPMFMKLDGKKVFVCGNGKIIEDKIQKLIKFNPDIYLFPENDNYSIENKNAKVINHMFTEDDLKELPVFVIASCDEERNNAIASACRKNNIPVNVVDHPDLCDFTFGSMVTTENLCIGISSSGVSPTAAIRIKRDIMDVLPDNIDNILEDMPAIRSWVHKWCPDKKMVPRVLNDIISMAFSLDRCLTREEIYSIKNYYSEGNIDE